MKKIVYLTLTLTLLMMVAGQSRSSLQEDKTVEIKQNQERCSPVVDGLQICTPSALITTKIGENIPVQIVIKNVTEKPISILKANLSDVYDIELVNSDGKKILSKEEVLKKKINENLATNDELINSLPLNSSPSTVIIEPLADLKTEFNLNQFYDITARGNYHLKISRKLLKQNNIGMGRLSFGTMEIKVK